MSELGESVRRQIDSLIGIATLFGGRVTHVKAHGALYNQAARDAGIARNVLLAIQAATGNAELVVFVPPGSAMWQEAKALGMRVAREGFVDRAYEPDGTLRSRTLAGALVTNPAQAAGQALSFVRDGGVTCSDGTFLRLAVDTICLHGDTPGAPEIARAVRDALRNAKVKVVSFRA